LFARSIPLTKLPNTRRVRSPQWLKVEEDTMLNKRVSEVRRNLSSRRKPRPPRRLPLDWNAPFARERAYTLSPDANLSSSELPNKNLNTK